MNSSESYSKAFGRYGSVREAVTLATFSLNGARAFAKATRDVADALYAVDHYDEVAARCQPLLKELRHQKRKAADRALRYTLQAVVLLRCGASLT